METIQAGSMEINTKDAEIFPGASDFLEALRKRKLDVRCSHKPGVFQIVGSFVPVGQQWPVQGVIGELWFHHVGRERASVNVKDLRSGKPVTISDIDGKSEFLVHLPATADLIAYKFLGA